MNRDQDKLLEDYSVHNKWINQLLELLGKYEDKDLSDESKSYLDNKITNLLSLEDEWEGVEFYQDYLRGGFDKLKQYHSLFSPEISPEDNNPVNYAPEIKKEIPKESIDNIIQLNPVSNDTQKGKDIPKTALEKQVEIIDEIEQRNYSPPETQELRTAQEPRVTADTITSLEPQNDKPATEKQDKPTYLLPKKKVELWSDINQYIAPWIIGNELVKEILATQMFSNPSKGEKLHYLLVGNVASGKSELLDFISACVPNSAYVGKKITRVGMSEKLAKCNNGLISLDEFDKVSFDVRDQLLECMQSQKITDIAHRKDEVLETKVNVLAACNPEKSILRDNVPIYEQTNLSIPLLSRFHLIMPFYQINPEFYGDLAVSNHKHKDPDKIKELQKQIYDHVDGVREKYPVIECPENILRDSGDFIATLRDKASGDSLEYEHINPRTIEGFINFVKARSRMKLKPEVGIEEFEESKQIYETFYLKNVGDINEKK
ncbi:sigma 54-interacting transcriptional regulator [Candidatus Woesearchaeota archaeon]|jgi:DNA replicative helicase MCM subunit Mcm2 (Cdc46/Mcm family)|nr:sigma 54-interacting transcriptional regulator [Candidatus Woesearchaeota archaeon]